MDPHLTNAPLASFITFHTYGTWLPGDPRGSVDRYHRLRGALYVGRAPTRQAASARALVHPPVELGPEERTIVLHTIQEVCQHRGWVLRAAHVRVNHVHVVTQATRADHTPERVMNDLKAWTTRRVIEAGLRAHGARLWVRHGSTRSLWRPEAVEAACAYVIAGQGEGRQWAYG